METLLAGITSITIGQIAMMLIGAVLIYLGIKKSMNLHYLCLWDWVPSWSTSLGQVF
jgi:Na+-transporting methylmalonyl-CoA/oxaloacetate decarboxylase beta subunit